MADSLSPELGERLALHLVPGLGPRLTGALLERFGSPAAALKATPAELRTIPHIGSQLAGDLHRAFQEVDIASEQALMERHGAHLVALGNPDYPTPLAQVVDPPDLLYFRGAWEPRDSNAVAIVGSRHATSYGRRIAERLAAGLVRAGYTIVSGLARGIDAAAHRGALQEGGRTLAVLAGGLSKIYPPEHTELARDVAQAGALISEAPMGLDPLAGMFPARNRLISGLSRGVVVVEAAERSGALITARHAADQGRTVFAIPGPVDSAASAGTLRLLRDGATLVRGVDDILEDLDGVAPGQRAAPTEAPPELAATPRRIWEFLAGAPRHLDEIGRELRLDVPQVTKELLILEMRKVVRRLSGNRYERC
jgi:DNA processing protein